MRGTALALEKVITPDILEEQRQSMHHTKAEISVSKFNVKIHYDLVEVFGNLGVLDVFNPVEGVSFWYYKSDRSRQPVR